MYPAALQAKQDPGTSLQQHLLTQRKLMAHRASQFTTQNGNTNSTATVAAARESVAGSNNVATVVTEAELMSHHIEYSQK